MYDLEQAIMVVWQTKDDMQLLYNNIESLDEDQTLNTLLGLIELTDLRCKALFEAYERVLKKGDVEVIKRDVNEGVVVE
jgi:hypothetical protein